MNAAHLIMDDRYPGKQGCLTCLLRLVCPEPESDSLVPSDVLT